MILNKLAKKIHSIKFNSFINEIKILFFNIINSIVFSCDPSRYFNCFITFTNFIKRSRIIKIEMILINVLACRWKLEQFATIILVDCNSRTLYEISKCFKKKLKYREGSHEKTIELIMIKNKNFISLKNELNLMLCILFANLFNIFLCEVLLPL